MTEFGVIVGCCQQDLHLALGCCASIRYFLGDVDVCLLVDGDADTTVLEQTYGVRTLRTADILDPDLRAECHGWGRSQLAMYWEAPWPTFLLLDADTLVWGDVRRGIDFERSDMVVDTHLADLFPDTPASPSIAAFLGHAGARRSARKLRHATRWYFDVRQIGHHIPGIDWFGEVNRLFCGGAIFARRGVLSRERFLELAELGRRHPGLFSAGNMGIINALVVAEGIRVHRVPGLQQLVPLIEPGRMAREYSVDPEAGPVVGDRPVVLHWPGRAKPTLDGRLAYSEPMTYFRRRFLSDAGGRDPGVADAVLTEEDGILLGTMGLAPVDSRSASASLAPSRVSKLASRTSPTLAPHRFRRRDRSATRAARRAVEDHATLALEKGFAALAMVNQPTLLIATSEGAQSIASPFTAALVLTALAAPPERQWRSMSGPHVRYLLDTLEPPSLWRFSNTVQPLPLDADDSACALAALRLWGRAEANYESAFAAILAFARADGTCPTWLVEEHTNLPGRENEVDVVVNVNILLLATLLAHPLPGMTSFVADFVNRNGLDCSRRSLYYRSPFVFAYFLSRWLGRQAGADLQDLKDRVLGECEGLWEEALSTPLACALSMNCQLDLGPAGAREWGRLEKMAGYLVGEQHEAGLWPAAPIFGDPAGNVYSSIQVTSVVCLEALHKYTRARQGERPLWKATDIQM